MLNSDSQNRLALLKVLQKDLQEMAQLYPQAPLQSNYKNNLAMAYATKIEELYAWMLRNQVLQQLSCPILSSRSVGEDKQEASGCSASDVYSALFLVALLSCFARRGHAPNAVTCALLWALKCLIAPFAWGKSVPAKIREYDQSKADARESVTFAASLQFLDPKLMPPEPCMRDDVNEVRLTKS